MSLTLAAVGAVVAALLQSTIVPYLRIGGAEPDLVLVYAVLVTVIVGIDHGLTAAFFGGIIIDVLAPRPLGSTAFVMLVAVGGAAVIGRLFTGGRTVAAIVAVFLMSVVSPLLFLVVYGALRGPIPAPEPLMMVLPDAIYSTVLAALVGPPAVYAHRRYFEQDRMDW
jgi:rod shape-determining protein MreD